MNGRRVVGLLLLFAAGGSVPGAGADQGLAPMSPRPGAAPAGAPRVLTPTPRLSAEQVIAETVQRFAVAYARRGSPRIGVYWNRQVDDMLSQWESERRTVVERRDGPGGAADGSAPAHSQGEHVTTEQRSVGRRPANDLSEQPEAWDAHEGFLEPLLAARARLVDRAAIQRLTASEAPSRRSPGDQDRQIVEMSALREYADLWVEITAAGVGADRRMRAVVKDVRTGSILVYVTAPGGTAVGSAPRSYRPTPRGFEPVDEAPLSPRQVSTQLSVSLMDALIAHWMP